MKSLMTMTMTSAAFGFSLVVFARLLFSRRRRPLPKASSRAASCTGVGITGCHDCHSPKSAGMKPDPERLLSGRPTTAREGYRGRRGRGARVGGIDGLDGRLGRGQGRVEPDADPATGLGARYNEAKFIQTMRTGKKPEGVQLLPPMPTDVYQNMSDDDLKAIYAFTFGR